MPSTNRSQGTNAIREQIKGQHGGPRVFYVSYDGAQEPLGRSQIVPYLVRLAADYEITLVSFEKTKARGSDLAAELAGRGIRWIPLRYHRRPPVLSTVLDVVRAKGALGGAARLSGSAAVVHVRSYVPALMAETARGTTNGRLLFDIRGFWADERVEGGLWRSGGPMYRVAKGFERRFFSDADAIVTLTEASLPQIRKWTGTRDVPIEVIPTCVDFDRFGERPERPGGPHAVWSGSIGTWYRFDLTERIARALGLPLTVLTLQAELARSMLAGYPASVRSVAPDLLPRELHCGDIGLCLIASSFSKTASAPTRFGEYLAAGMPVMVTRGVGDLERIVTERDVGVVLEGEDQNSVARAAERIRDLAADDRVRARCRFTARELFDVRVGAERYAKLYRRLLSTGGSGRSG